MTNLEKEFVSEAERGGFVVEYDKEGHPYALGADMVGNLFSMDVTETPEREGESRYTLP